MASEWHFADYLEWDDGDRAWVWSQSRWVRLRMWFRRVVLRRPVGEFYVTSDAGPCMSAEWDAEHGEWLWVPCG